MIFWWVFLFWCVWALCGFVRAIFLLDHKNHKENLLDSILLAGALPLAYLFGFVTNPRESLNGFTKLLKKKWNEIHNRKETRQ